MENYYIIILNEKMTFSVQSLQRELKTKQIVWLQFLEVPLIEIQRIYRTIKIFLNLFFGYSSKEKKL